MRETAYPKIIRALAELPERALEMRRDDLLRAAQIQPQVEEKLQRMILELVPDFIVEPQASKPIVVTIERK